MFWVRYADLRPYLSTQNIFTNDDNNLATCTYDGLLPARPLQRRDLQDPESEKQVAHAALPPTQTLWLMRRTAYSVDSKHSKTNSGCLRLKNPAARREAAEKAELAAAGQNSAATDAAASEAPKKSSVRSSRSKRGSSEASKKSKPAKVKKPKPRKPHHRHQRSDRSVTANADSHPKPKAILCLQKNPGFQRHGSTQKHFPSSHLTPAGRLPTKTFLTACQFKGPERQAGVFL